MSTLISVLIIIVCILLILVVLVQNSKGGGLASNFSSGNQMMGVKKTADFLEKLTWGLAISLLLLSLASAPYSKPSATISEDGATESVTRKKASEAPAITAPPAGIQNNPIPVAPSMADSTKK